MQERCSMGLFPASINLFKSCFHKNTQRVHDSITSFKRKIYSCICKFDTQVPKSIQMRVNSFKKNTQEDKKK